jgi:phenylacetate-CoA ligase
MLGTKGFNRKWNFKHIKYLVMSIRNLFTEKIILPLSDIALGQSVSKHLKFLHRSQWWTEVELKEYQNEKLRALIKHAYDNVPYYTELFNNLNFTPSSIKTTDDLVKLPILTKEIIRKNFKSGKIVAKNIPKQNMILSGSSGSTGEPLQYFITKDLYSMAIAANIRGWYWMGFRLGEKYIKLSVNPRYQGVKKIQDIIINCIYFSSQKIDDKDIVNFINLITEKKPHFVRGYPSTLSVIARYIMKEKIHIDKLKAVNTTGEILFPEVRNIISNAFNCPVYDSYGCEGGTAVFECPTHECYHSANEHTISEIIDNNEKPTNHGRLITTDLFNYAVPFIRYNTQDIVTTHNEKCSCKRELFSIKKIEGREVDILKTPSGKNLIVHYFTGYFEWIKSVSQFQVIQYKADTIVLKIVPNNLFDSDEEKMIFSDISTYIGEDVNFSIEKVKKIPVNPKNGKRRFVIRK